MPENFDREATLYEKIGEEYVAVGKRDIVLPYSIGDYLIRVNRASRSIIQIDKQRLDYDDVALMNVMSELQDHICHAISTYHSYQPSKTKMTRKEQKAWKDYIKAGGYPQLHGKSYFEIAKLAVESLREKIAERIGMKTPPDGCVKIWDTVVF